MHARQPSHVVELARRRVLEADAADPRLDRDPALNLDRLVRPLGAHDLPRPFISPLRQSSPKTLLYLLSYGPVSLLEPPGFEPGTDVVPAVIEDGGDKSGETGVTAPLAGAAGVRTRTPHHVVPPAFTPCRSTPTMPAFGFRSRSRSTHASSPCRDRQPDRPTTHCPRRGRPDRPQRVAGSTARAVHCSSFRRRRHALAPPHWSWRCRARSVAHRPHRARTAAPQPPGSGEARLRQPGRRRPHNGPQWSPPRDGP